MNDRSGRAGMPSLMELVLYGYAGLCAVGLVQAALMFVFQYEQHRYYRGRLRAEIDHDWRPRVALFVPCKGLDADLEANLAKLFGQDYPNYELCFIVEAIDDPAHAVIQRVRDRMPKRNCRVVVSGTATDCGQKVHNLIAATRELSDDVEVLAFADSDARPHRHWLSRLVQRLHSEKVGASTGYRWFVPRSVSAPNWIACGINSQVAGLMGSHRLNLVWGGAWAIRSTTFRQLGLPAAWRGSLSDDLVVSRLVHSAGLKVVFEPHCLAASSVEFDWPSLTEFVRRQFRIVRVYAPRWWASALCAASAHLTWLLASSLLTVHWMLSGGPWWIPAIGGAIHFLLMCHRQALRNRGLWPFVPADRSPLRGLSAREIVGWPVVSGFQCFALLASAIGRTICWRGISYRMDSPSTTVILARAPNPTDGRPSGCGLAAPEPSEVRERNAA